MCTEAWYYKGLCAKLFETVVLTSSDVIGSALNTEEIKEYRFPIYHCYMKVMLLILIQKWQYQSRSLSFSPSLPLCWRRGHLLYAAEVCNAHTHTLLLLVSGCWKLSLSFACEGAIKRNLSKHLVKVYHIQMKKCMLFNFSVHLPLPQVCYVW